MRILVVDNYDSFVFNLVQYLGQLGVQAEVWRNDDARLSDPSDGHAIATQFDGVLLSPGPGTPERAGASISLVRACAAERTRRCSGSAWATRPSASHSAPPLTALLSCCTARPAAYSTRMPVSCKDFRIRSRRPATTR